MPGISITFDLSKKKNSHDEGARIRRFQDALNSILHNEYYTAETVLNDDNCLIGCTKYPEYPVKIFENSEFWVCLEGKIYGKQDNIIKDEINHLVSIVFGKKSSNEAEKETVSDWLIKTDGDFVIYALNKETRDLAILNDVLGRLPIYYYRDDSKLLVSREIEFISHIIRESHIGYNNKDQYDKMGMAQFLLFSHTLGKRTLLKDIYRLEPASLLTVDSKDSKTKIDALHTYNFENKKYSSVTLEKNAHQLVSLFSNACKIRLDNNTKNMITMSGGFDSRSIAAWFHKNQIHAYGATTVDPSWKPLAGNLSDSKVAKQLAESLNIQWEYYHFNEPRAKDLVTLLRIKKGLTYLGYGFLIQFVDNLRHKYGLSPLNVFVGYSGDRILADLSIQYQNIEQLTSAIMATRTFMPLSHVVSIVQIAESEVVDEIRNTLRSYPEKSPSQKLVHFLFYGRQFKYVFEAEDIHRFYFWIVNPFYSIPFFNYAMNCPDEHKCQLSLYREFLLILSPLAAGIKSSNWGSSILSRKFKIVQYVLSFTVRHHIIKKIIKMFTRTSKDMGYHENAKNIRCMREQLKNCEELSNYLSRHEMEEIIEKSSHYKPAGIDNLFTIISLMEKNTCNNCTIEKVYDK